MKKVGLLIMILGCFTFTTKVKAQTTQDTLVEKVSTLKDRVDGVDERLTTVENDLSKLKKIKISGYIQAQFENYADRTVMPNSFFSLRRARVKFTYEAAEGVAFVLQPDFQAGLSSKKEGSINSYVTNMSIKDAYVVANDPWLGMFSLTAGKFNRCNYEVEYSSSSREVPERSRVITTLYPSERAIGAKLEFNPKQFPLHIQLALLNGSEALTIKDTLGNNLTFNENKDYDNFKDIMARATYNVKLNSMMGLDFGVHGYFGSLRSGSKTTLHSDYKTTDIVSLGDAIHRNFYGIEAQLYIDWLGGMSLKGEYLFGQNATIGNIGTSAAATQTPNFVNNFKGFYVYLNKNIGKKNEFTVRYDYYDPNTDIKGDSIGVTSYLGVAGKINKMKSGSSDIAYQTLTLAWQYFLNDNVKLMVGYSIVANEKVGQTKNSAGQMVSNYYGTSTTLYDGSKIANDFSSIVNQNILTIRLQAKF